MLTSCSGMSKRVNDDDLIGKWTGPGNAVLSLREGHSFVAKRLPLQIIDPDAFGAPQDVSGSWQIERPGLDAPSLDLTIKSGVYELTVGNEHDHWIIFYYITDPDLNKRYVFHKVVAE